jgi:plasmid stabilization system protein ParE
MVAKERAVVWSESAQAGLAAEVKFIAKTDPSAARDVRRKLDATGTALGVSLTGRPGRVPGTYEKTVTGLRFVLAYAVMPAPGEGTDDEVVVTHRAIHTLRDWPPGDWPD